MMPSAHFFSGVSIFAFMGIFGLVPRNLSYLSLLVLCSIIPDTDVVLSSMHREQITHSLAFWMLISIVAVAASPSAWIVIPPFLLHLFLDTLDWGVMIMYPFSRKKYGLKLAGKGTEVKSESLSLYVKEYLSRPILLYAEIGLMVLSLILLVSVGQCS